LAKKVIDYIDYFNAQNYNNKTARHISAIVMNVQPKITAILDNEISKMSASKDIYEALKNNQELQDHLDLTVITSLCYILAQYLIDLSQRPNTLNIDEENLEKFTVNLMCEMLRTFEVKDE